VSEIYWLKPYIWPHANPDPAEVPIGRTCRVCTGNTPAASSSQRRHTASWYIALMVRNSSAARSTPSASLHAAPGTRVMTSSVSPVDRRSVCRRYAERLHQAFVTY